MNLKEPAVTVMPRAGVDLDNLSSSTSPLHVPCGRMGILIARAVKEGGGKANILLADLKIAMDSQSGVEAIFDNFELVDAKSSKPFVMVLIAHYLK